ncbi:MAG: hypothetical protein AAF654_11475 [Myxococcota bacterium]
MMNTETEPLRRLLTLWGVFALVLNGLIGTGFSPSAPKRPPPHRRQQPGDVRFVRAHRSAPDSELR